MNLLTLKAYLRAVIPNVIVRQSKGKTYSYTAMCLFKDAKNKITQKDLDTSDTLLPLQQMHSKKLILI